MYGIERLAQAYSAKYFQEGPAEADAAHAAASKTSDHPPQDKSYQATDAPSDNIKLSPQATEAAEAGHPDELMRFALLPHHLN